MIQLLYNLKRTLFMKTIPEYYFDQISEKTAKINALKKDASFMFITDLHIHDNAFVSVPLIKKVSKLTGIKKLISGGDYAYAFGADNECIDDTVNSIKYLSEVKPELKFYSVRGNHDITIRHDRNSETGYTHPESETNKIILSENSPVTKVMPNEACYYFDDENEKIRYVVINTSDTQSEDVGKFWGVNYSVSAPQIKWLAENAFKFENGGEGWGIIVFGHVPVSDKMDANNGVYKDVNDELIAVKNKKAGNFGNYCGLKAELIAYICGHVHVDNSIVDGGVLHVTTGPDAYYNDDIYKRVLGTVTETLFSAFTVDKTEHKLHLIRFGAGEDKTFDY